MSKNYQLHGQYSYRHGEVDFHKRPLVLFEMTAVINSGRLIKYSSIVDLS